MSEKRYNNRHHFVLYLNDDQWSGGFTFDADGEVEGRIFATPLESGGAELFILDENNQPWGAGKLVKLQKGAKSHYEIFIKSEAGNLHHFANYHKAKNVISAYPASRFTDPRGNAEEEAKFAKYR